MKVKFYERINDGLVAHAFVDPQTIVETRVNWLGESPMLTFVMNEDLVRFKERGYSLHELDRAIKSALKECTTC